MSPAALWTLPPLRSDQTSPIPMPQVETQPPTDATSVGVFAAKQLPHRVPLQALQFRMTLAYCPAVEQSLP